MNNRVDSIPQVLLTRIDNHSYCQNFFGGDNYSCQGHLSGQKGHDGQSNIHCQVCTL